ncbi:MAG: response regulator [Planctomycetota bacterium]
MKGALLVPNGECKQVDVVAVDDDRTVCSFLRSLFEMQDWRAEVFERPSDALAFLGAHTAAVLLTDINMPEMNGIELARILHQRHPDLTLVAFTGSVDDPTVYCRHFTGVIRKPATVDQILETVEQALAHRDRPTA